MIIRFIFRWLNSKIGFWSGRMPKLIKKCSLFLLFRFVRSIFFILRHYDGVVYAPLRWRIIGNASIETQTTEKSHRPKQEIYIFASVIAIAFQFISYLPQDWLSIFLIFPFHSSIEPPPPHCHFYCLMELSSGTKAKCK